jgi:hypothetical protein
LEKNIPRQLSQPKFANKQQTASHKNHNYSKGYYDFPYGVKPHIFIPPSPSYPYAGTQGDGNLYYVPVFFNVERYLGLGVLLEKLPQLSQLPFNGVPQGIGYFHVFPASNNTHKIQLLS